MRALDNLRDIEQVLHAYCSGMDRKDWALVASCYHPDARDDHGTTSGSIEEFIVWLTARHDRVVQSFHAITGVRLIAERRDAAVTESMCLVRQTLQKRDGTLLRISIGCWYIDLFRQMSGKWLIGQRRVTYDWIEEVVRGADLLEGTELQPTDRGTASIDDVCRMMDGQ